MQVVSPSSPAPIFVGKESFTELYDKLNDDFSSKPKADFSKEEDEDDNNLDKSWWNQDDDEEEEEEEEEGEEFSFTSVKPVDSPITAEEAFEDGQIRPVYPLLNRNVLFEPDEISLRLSLKKLFVEREEATTEREEESEPIGPYCSWPGPPGRTVVEEDSSETCGKSNSTGFSKLWRFRDLLLRSNSDGKDAFVFLNHHGDKKNQSSSTSSAGKMSGGVKRTEKGKEKMKMKTRSAHERLYMSNRAIKEEEKRRSYLPYKHVGFFTNVHGLTRNVHPF